MNLNQYIDDLKKNKKIKISEYEIIKTHVIGMYDINPPVKWSTVNNKMINLNIMCLLKAARKIFKNYQTAKLTVEQEVIINCLDQTVITCMNERNKKFN